jgi:hypothetical protein
MKNYIPTFNDFINESKLPSEIDNALKQSKLEWKENEDIADELYDAHKGDTAEAYAYIANDKSRGRKYVFKTWLNDRMYTIQVEEDETVIFIQQYPKNEKRFYDQDCENILGFSF